MLLATIAALAVLATAPAGRAGPTLATEDTMRTETSEVLVRAPRVTLDEILDRVARGEAKRDSLIRDQMFTVAFRLVRNAADKKKTPQLMSESVYRVYKKRPDKVRGIKLREWRLRPEKDDGENEVNFRSDMSEQIVNFAFRPDARHQFTYKIVGRDLVGDHLVYRIAFEPRSLLDPSVPSGVVWVDTNEFVIVRQEVNFERSPVPIILKNVDRMVIERQHADGMWVLKRLLLRATFTIALPEVGRSMDMSLQFSEYANNHGVADSVFAVKGRR